MDKFLIIVWLLPIVFMIHDFEEIIAFKPWIAKNGASLKKRFPFLSSMLSRIEKMSVQAFTIAVFEEFLLLSIITFTAVYFSYYYIWLAVFMAFSIHLIIHIAQWLVIRKYIPTIVTTLLALPYCVYGFIQVVESGLFSTQDIVIASLCGIVLMVVNLILAHSIAIRLDKKSLSNIKFFIY